MSDAVTVLHDDVLITYEEKRDVWTFSLRGRERSAESLTKAKEAIDKVPVEAKKKPFERVPVYCYDGYSSTVFKKGEITSIAESRYSTPEVWVSFDGKREKKNASNVFPIGPANDGTIAILEALQSEITAIESKRYEAKKKLQSYSVPNESI